MKYYIAVYGCQMNKSDSERIASVLENIGYSPAQKEDEADILILVACSVRQSAIDRIYGLISKIKKQKSKTQIKKQKIILTGCVLPEDRKKLKDQVDLIFDIKDLAKLPQKLNKEPINLSASQFTDYFTIPPHYQSNFQAYVPISTGCNNFCTYCVVPYTRGPEKSRPAKEIIAEVKNLIKKGYKEIILLGQNVNSYISPTNYKLNSRIKNINFAKLLQMINNISGNFWLRFITSHPKDLSDELIETMTKCEKVCEYLHLPVQSGDDQILKKMNRGYTVKYYKNLIDKIRKKFAKVGKKISISTDIIVGFPGETKKQFENTAKLMRWAKFDMAYIAQYSPRPGTPASKLKDNVPIKEKERRRKILTEILKKTALENNRKYLNETVEVLLSEQKNNYLFGKTRTFKTVRIKNTGLSTGQFVKVKITSANPWGLGGKII